MNKNYKLQSLINKTFNNKCMIFQRKMFILIEYEY